MMLVDILETCRDSININVFDLENNLISKYDRRNSIDEELNNRQVRQIDVNGSVLNIWLEDN